MTGALRISLPAVALAALVGGSTAASSTASPGTRPDAPAARTKPGTPLAAPSRQTRPRTTRDASTGGARPPPGSGRPPAASPVAAAPGHLASGTLRQLDATLAFQMRRAGTSSGAYVVDLSTDQVLYSLRPTTPRIPASIEKLYTTSTALARFGPGTQLLTSVLGVGGANDKGVWTGNLYVHGGGDPTFGTDSPPGSQATPTNLAAALLAATGIARLDGAVVGDETLFDSRRGDPSTGYLADSDLGGQLSALADAHGSLGRVSSPALFAASRFARALRASGVTVTGRTTVGPTPAGARLLTSVRSPNLATIVALTDQPSDNFYAETLLKDLGAYYGAGGSTAAGTAVVRSWLAPLGIRPHLLDGSGLSDGDRTTPQQVVSLLRDLNPSAGGQLAPIGAALLAALPVAGRTGTLARRMRRTPAAGRCQAKTGTLDGVSNLAGVCDGRYAFAFLMNQIAATPAHALQDRMTQAIAALPA